jgi:signal transduction histidine kinase
MNALAALGITYLFITICSASILYFSFNGKIDASGKYFFLGELSIIPGIIGVILGNLNSAFIASPVLFIINLSTWSSHVCVLFSIYALSNGSNNKKFIWAVGSALLYASMIEFVRQTNSSVQATTLLASIADASFSIWTYAICKYSTDTDLRKNLFFTWIKNIELMLGLFAIMRIASCFMTETPINVRFPTPTIITFYIFFLILNIFRYISYQSLRISWVDNRTLSINPLNRNLVVVTQEKNSLLQDLIASNRVIGIGALASSLAHQLSQPLTAIGLQTETLKRDLNNSGGNQVAVIMLDKINSQLSKLTNLVKNLRQLFNTNIHDFHKVDLAFAVNELLEIIEPTLEAKKIRLRKSISSNISILGDAIQIQQVLINLFNNAIDAISSADPQSREISISVRSDDQFALIDIEDTGAGIDINMLPTIFELYKTSKKDGLGIGLWLCKTIINKHHGEISVSNRSDGGARFTIQIPLSKTPS